MLNANTVSALFLLVASPLLSHFIVILKSSHHSVFDCWTFQPSPIFFTFSVLNLINFTMVETAEIEKLLEEGLRIEENSESEWEELEVGSQFEDDEVPEIPVTPCAHSTLMERLIKRRISLSKRANLTFPCARVLRYMKSRFPLKRVQRGNLRIFFGFTKQKSE